MDSLGFRARVLAAISASAAATVVVIAMGLPNTVAEGYATMPAWGVYQLVASDAGTREAHGSEETAPFC